MKHNDMKRNKEQRITRMARILFLHHTSCGLLLRTLLLLMVMTVGVSGVWGQSSPVGNDFSGTYYIANYNANAYSPTSKTDNYYLCPSVVYYDYNGTPANQKPYLTTHKPDPTGRPNEPIAKWKIVFASTDNTTGVDYYYIKYVAPDGNEKYMVHNEKIVSNNADRVRLHLQSDKDATEDNNLFSFTAGTKGDKKNLNICPKASANSNRSLNPAKANTDYYTGQNVNNPGSFKQGSTTIYCGGLIGYYDSNDDRGLWYLEDIVENPVVSINSDGKAIISSSNTSATYYYTTDGTTIPTTGSAQYTAPIDIAGVETIKAIAVVDGESSNVATFTVGNGTPYLIQNQECTAYYLVPGDPSATNVTATTSSIAGPKMEWLRKFAGNVNGIQYYYFVNNSTKDYLYYSGEYVYVKSSSDIIPSDGSYKFNIFARNADESFNIFPNGVANGLYKRSYNASPDGILISTDASQLVNDFYRWKFIPTSGVTDKKPLFDAPKDNTGTALTLSSVTSGTVYYFISNVGTSGSYIVSSASATNASTSTTETDEAKSWMLVKAGEDNWQTYYHIVSAATGKYMHFIGTDASSTSDMNNAIEMQEQPSGIADQFVLARATNANTYYIIPKLHYNTFKNNKYYCLNDNSSQVKTTLSRASNVNTVKWTFEENTSAFCLDPIFKQDAVGNVSLSCPTIGAEIHFTDDGTTPDKESSLYDEDDSWEPSEQKLIKAIAVLKNNKDISSSNIIALFNNPDITLNPEYTNYTYDGEPHEPGITDVSITVGGNTFSPTSPASYTTAYTDNVNAGTATVTLTDVEGDSWYIWNGSRTFTITQKAITITAASDTKGYDSTPLTNDGYTCSPTLATGDSFESVTVTGSQTAVGSSSNVPSAAVIVNGNNENMTTNYAITYANGTLTVTLRSIGDGTLASGFTLVFGEGGTIILKDGEITLAESTDYTVATASATSKYSTRTVSGNGNYTGYFSIRNAIANFQNDGNGGTEYSATFVAENAAGFASNDSHNGHALPEGITAYIITSISGNNAYAEALEYIPEGIPVLLLSNAASGGFLVQDASGHTEITSAQISNNMLEEVTTSTPNYNNTEGTEHYQTAHFNVRTIYLLSKNEFVHNMDGDLAKGKVYLNPNHSSGGGGNSRLFIIWDTETGINNSHLTPLIPHLSGTWYTLDGRRLNGKPVKKGLYLCNRQKTVVN